MYKPCCSCKEYLKKGYEINLSEFTILKLSTFKKKWDIGRFSLGEWIVYDQKYIEKVIQHHITLSLRDKHQKKYKNNNILVCTINDTPIEEGRNTDTDRIDSETDRIHLETDRIHLETGIISEIQDSGSSKLILPSFDRDLYPLHCI